MSVQSSVPVEKATPASTANAEKWQGRIISLLAISYLLLQIYPGQEMEAVVSVIILGVIVWVMPRIRGSTLTISTVLLLLAVGLMVYYEASVQEWLQAARVNLTLIALFLFVPLLGIPVRTGGYVEALKIVLARSMNEPRFFYIGSKLLTHMLGVVLNIGAVSIVYQLTKASNITSSRLIANALNRGFVTSIYWSPYFSAMALILSQLHITWSSIVLYSLGLVFISTVVSIGLDHSVIRSNEQEQKHREGIRETTDPIHLQKAKRKVIELFILLTLIMGLVLFVERMTSYSMVLIICLVSLIFPLLWCGFSGKAAPLIEQLQQHLDVGIPRMKKEIVLFLIAGFFSGAIVQAELSGYLIEAMNAVFGSFTMGIAFFFSLLIVLTAVVGLHPIVVVTILATSIDPRLIGLSPEYFAVLLLASWGISNTVSPATAVNNLLSHLLKENVLDVSIRWNLKYALIMLMFIPFYLWALNI
ncbi:hypothetical protein [Ammoniphilus sp. YIM 78166]|uniref:hypothetical protein n=1 Tax=Ammoniphilus sp. YIM 78166 TaxID=1644106 RepID=UPI00106FE716|nr:hypothetical protein [Ammoniphilus sp. YIM 78166]